MRMKTPIRYAVFSLLGAFILPVASADNIGVVLDGHDYDNSIDIVYLADSQRVKYANITGCSRPNGQIIPASTSVTQFKNGDGVYIGLSSVTYNLSQGRFYLSSEVGDLKCDGADYSDELFAGGFD